MHYSLDIATTMASVLRALLFCSAILLLWLAFLHGADAQRHRGECPNAGYDHHGYWSVDEKEGTRCVLTCSDGYEPSGCHVLRRKGDDWNYAVPHCTEVPLVSSQTKTFLLATGAGVVAVVAAPAALAAFGFTTAGVAAGSVAASLQTPFTAAGSWFALGQSAGAAGLAVSTKVVVGATAAGATYVLNGKTCESE